MLSLVDFIHSFSKHLLYAYMLCCVMHMNKWSRNTLGFRILAAITDLPGSTPYVGQAVGFSGLCSLHQ